MKYQEITFPFFALLAIIIVITSSSHSGGNLTGACNSCHGSNTSANGSIILTGLPNSGNVTSNTTYSMQLCIVDPGRLAAGFRVETDLGILATVNAETQTNGANDRITHTFPKPFGSPGNPACWDFDWTSPSTGATEPTFTLRGNAVNANGSTSGDNAGYIESSQGLPVEFASFSLDKKDESIHVSWATASEINNDRFIVQRSRDNVLFTNIATLQGQSSTTALTEYHYEDKVAPQNLLYYRILQIDIDGTIDYSDTRVIDNMSTRSLEVYPNPINLNESNVLHINGSNNSLYLLNTRGEILKTYTRGSDNEYIELDDNLTSGTYYITDRLESVAITLVR